MRGDGRRGNGWMMPSPGWRDGEVGGVALITFWGEKEVVMDESG